MQCSVCDNFLEAKNSCDHKQLVRTNGTLAVCEECQLPICGECGRCFKFKKWPLESQWDEREYVVAATIVCVFCGKKTIVAADQGLQEVMNKIPNHFDRCACRK